MIESSIKWPNDILTKNGKLAGILIENTIGGKYIKHSIIGIGINVNQTDFNGISATSVALELGRMVPKDELLMLLIKELNATKDLLQLKQFDLLKKEYLSHLWRLNEAVKFVRNEQEEDGVIVGTNEFGLLEVQTQHGIEVFDIKEVKFITSEL